MWPLVIQSLKGVFARLTGGGKRIVRPDNFVIRPDCLEQVIVKLHAPAHLTVVPIFTNPNAPATILVANIAFFEHILMRHLGHIQTSGDSVPQRAEPRRVRVVAIDEHNRGFDIPRLVFLDKLLDEWSGESAIGRV
jgi:hypothetical protein